jgi:uncharacterized protein (TIGR02246 family)
MMRVTEVLVGSVVVAALAACAPKPAATDNSAVVAAVRAAQDRELAAVSSGNIDSALSVYAPDVMMMPPGEPAMNGHEALRKWLDAMYKDYSFSGKYTSSDVQVSGDLAVAHYVGEMTMTPKKGGAPMTEKLKGVHVYKRQPDGTWKVAQDVWNSDAPAAPPPAQARAKKT